ncbi:AraC family transcriptional regulator [Pseudomonas vanderleydeniana]|uniref:AraC family transcriptional regulator n=2 Tax=Pseudomonas vanderleydeniana TaxID=2745495 RepID=A0A9E6PSJ0_9PSED|nr:AraC family transcriptional regulator [Pseudomonas vanderleydeniana]
MISKKSLKIKEVFDCYGSAVFKSIEPNKLDFSLIYRFLDEVYECTEDVDIGLVAYQYARPGFFGVPGYSMMSSPTLGVALERLVKYSPLITNAPLIRLDDRDGRLNMTVHLEGSSCAQAPRYIIDAAAAVMLGLVHWLGHPLKAQPSLIELPYSRPADTTSLESLFGRCLNFDAPHLSLSFSHDIREAPVFTANPAFEETHCRYADALLEEQLNGSLVEKVRSVFSAGVVEGRLPSLQNVADELHMSTRTLQKSLEREGVTFSELQENLRKEIAANLLSIPALSLKEISSVLGFCQPSSLHKACQRWFGSSPGQVRAKNSRNLPVH